MRVTTVSVRTVMITDTMRKIFARNTSLYRMCVKATIAADSDRLLAAADDRPKASIIVNAMCLRIDCSRSPVES